MTRGLMDNTLGEVGLVIGFVQSLLCVVFGRTLSCNKIERHLSALVSEAVIFGEFHWLHNGAVLFSSCGYQGTFDGLILLIINGYLLQPYLLHVSLWKLSRSFIWSDH
ncbi:hypothetical protein KIN20_011210 [Parelaphostrongylus tenuis]|uniref:Uncharacterized protein n=1 Tax=Parelaphostrongylus tenuis TaxID=148309 RepID=A0AAD5MUN1_PARTN|nr:hypothetical protein KIN20_011210 [Parelaphostrongylus tenuis]